MTKLSAPIDYCNPWQLRPAEEQVLIRLYEYGSMQAIALKYKRNISTINCAIKRAVNRMGVKHRMEAVVVYQVWRQTKQYESQIKKAQEITAQLDLALYQLELERSKNSSLHRAI
jgi:DNA-binding CsgD family transcriptional regulator